jgi:hypothetical protein
VIETAVHSTAVSIYELAAGKTMSRTKSKSGRTTNKKWSARVTRESYALELEEGVFTWKDPRRIARSLKRSAETSTQRKARPFQSAMSMLNFYINRAGKKLDPIQRQVLEQAKQELRRLYKRT